MKKTLLIILTGFYSICSIAQSVEVEKQIDKIQLVQNERDNIYMLLAFSVVEQDWQKSTRGSNVRGYNIGGVLVNDKGELVNWARNTTVLCNDKTQHGEVRMLQAELQKKNNPSRYAKGYSLYTTLEPCMMCSGMMIFLKTKRVVYGQQDPDYGLNIERLKQPIAHYHNDDFRLKTPNSREKEITSELSKLEIAKQLSTVYEQTKEDYDNNITEFLVSESAHVLYKEALQKLLNYEIKFEENKLILKKVIDFYQKELKENKETVEDCPCTSCK